METRRVTRNKLGLDLSRTFRQKGSSRIMISKIHLGFLISLTKNGHFIDMDRIKLIRSSFLKKWLMAKCHFTIFSKHSILDV